MTSKSSVILVGNSCYLEIIGQINRTSIMVKLVETANKLQYYQTKNDQLTSKI